MEPATLRAHLKQTYGTTISDIARLDGDVFRVDREDDATWIARAFPPERPRALVDGDADILRFLAQHDYPAERLACDDAVSDADGYAVIVTEHVPGAIAGPDTLQALGELLGRLDTVPETGGAVSRPSGALHHWSPAGGGPAADLAFAAARLDECDARVPAAHRKLYDELRTLVADTSDCEDLPRSFVHPDFHRGNVLARPDGELVVIDWTGAGSGPRIGSFGLLLQTAVAKQYPGDASNEPDLARVEPVVAGYRAHVQLTDDELDRLPDAIRRPPLVFACWLFSGSMAAGGPPPPKPWWPAFELATAIAERARAAFAA